MGPRSLISAIFAALFTFFCHPISPSAQSFTVPSTWLDPVSNLTQVQCESLASGAVRPIISRFNSSGCISDFLTSPSLSATSFAVLALQDYYSGNQTYADVLTSNIQSCRAQVFSVDHNSTDGNSNLEAIYWSLAFFYAYRTYQLPDLLSTSIGQYDVANLSLVTDAAAAAGQGADRSGTLKNCFGSSALLSGVVFDVGSIGTAGTTSNSSRISSATAAAFMTISAYLFELSGNETYQANAHLSLNFLNSVLAVQQTPGVFSASYDLSSCRPLDFNSYAADSGWYIEGLSVLANITKNATLSTMLQQAVLSTISSWSEENGVVDDPFKAPSTKYPVESPVSTRKSIFIRGLTEARNRNPGTDMAAYIDAFLTVQFNSILAASKASDADLYTTSWSGSPNNGTLDPEGNLAAIDLLNAAFQIAPKSTGSPGGSGGNSTSNGNGDNNRRPSPNGSSSTGAIAGGVVGGFVALLLFLGAVYWRRTRQRRARRVSAILDSSDAEQPSEPPTGAVDPFILRTPAAYVPATKGHFSDRTHDEEAVPGISSQAAGGSRLDVHSASGGNSARIIDSTTQFDEDRDDWSEEPPPEYQSRQGA